MEQLILIVHVLAAIGIIGLIMIQQGKGADMGASFGSGASQTLFGSTGSGNALTKGTAILATVFFATSFGLAVLAKNKASSAGDVDIPVPAVVEGAGVESKSEVPAQVPADDIPQADGAEAQQASGELDIPELESTQDSGGTSGESGPADDIPQ